MRCRWGFRRHPAETAVQWFGRWEPCCYQHRAKVELSRLEIRLLSSAFERMAARLNAALATTPEQVERWVKLVGRR